jgi:hypothetical protein
MAHPIGHLIAAVLAGRLDIGATSWLRKKLDEVEREVGRLI